MCWVLNVRVMIKNEIMKRDMEISYEIVWAILRMAPKREYLELEDHPAIKVGYTATLEIHKNSSIALFRWMNGWGLGIRDHRVIAINIIRVGQEYRITVFALRGLCVSLENSLSASDSGWGKPLTDTLLGPFRSWEYPRILRSRRVKNAILSKIMIIDRENMRGFVIIGEL